MSNFQIFIGVFFFALLTIGTYEAAKSFVSYATRSNVPSFDSTYHEVRNDCS